ncbi:MAG: transglutaminase-like domain-containing protein [Oscillospiraceae bacterium]|nr:transglutaminase-like domain-containing protein [Oscillospiraceae bacterium]
MAPTNKRRILFAVPLLFACILLFAGCDTIDTLLGDNNNQTTFSVEEGNSPTAQKPARGIDLNEIASRPAVPLKHYSVASGDFVQTSSEGEIDYSNVADGYVMVKYKGDSTAGITDVKVGITTPNKERGMYTYNLPQDGEFYTFPLTEGDGVYVVSIFKRREGNAFNHLLAVDLNVVMDDEFKPFLIPHQKIVFSSESLSVKLAAELTKETDGLLRKVESVYKYVIGNIRYDKDKAIAAGNGELQAYIPDNDQILRSKMGICYDYATLTAAMLRSTDIPSKMVFGYASVGAGTDPVYHAWISVYSTESGWVDKVIEFTSNGWTRMDPTFSSSSNDKTMAKFIGDGNNYTDDFLF